MNENFSFKNILGFCDFHDLYYSVAEQLEDGDKIVEVGVMYGHSSAYMIDCVKKMNKRVTLYSIDLWDDVGVPEFNKDGDEILTNIFGKDYRDRMKNDPNIFYKNFLNNMVKCNSLDYIVPLKLSSVEASELFEDRSLKFCFIDAMHTYEAVKKDIEAWKPKVCPGGILAGHDYFWTGVKPAVDEAFPNVNVIGTSWWINV